MSDRNRPAYNAERRANASDRSAKIPVGLLLTLVISIVLWALLALALYLAFFS